ncbi:MAG: radical SAM protein [Prevotella sp.]
MKKIGLLDVDGHNFPNLALMKLARYHRSCGDDVMWYNHFEDLFDTVYMSKVFTFTADYGYVMLNARSIVKGGTGYSLSDKLPQHIDLMQPDYSIYPGIPDDTAYGFLTRGCPNRCPWCIVPEKEGREYPYMDVDDIAIEGRSRLILLDNNVLASDTGIMQLEKIVRRGYRVDFIQGLDARLVTKEIARLLARVKWIKRIRFGCDSEPQLDDCANAVNLIRSWGYNGEFFFYVLLRDDIMDSLRRASYWRFDKKCFPHCQPYIEYNNPCQRIPQWQRDMAQWADRKEIYRSCSFYDYEPRKGFRCAEYFY